jgi:hypothetical protein
MREKLLALILDCIVKLNLMPRNGNGSVLIYIQDYKIVSADIEKEKVRFV